MASLTPEQVRIIKSTVPVLAQHGCTITSEFYHTMLEAHPELRNIFNNTHQATGHQAQALATALYAYAASIDDLGRLSPAIELICHKHASLFVRDYQYEIVGKHLLETMARVLGNAATPKILEAWGAAYWQLANIMIEKEDELYRQTAYWPDWKDFLIVRKVKESEVITSFYLEPSDGMKLPAFKPGQYISVNVFVQELDGGIWQARQYSLSDAPGKKYLRISVKREPAVERDEPAHMSHPGYISNILHDTKNEGDIIKVSHPFGDFFYDDASEIADAPIVLISAGVGLTALMSILNSLVERKSDHQITWIHGASNEETRAFKTYLDNLTRKHGNVHLVNFLSNPKQVHKGTGNGDIKGRVDLDRVSQNDLFVKNDKTQYLICGPTQFMMNIEEKLRSYGVPASRTKMELFGTGGVPRI